MTNFKEITIEGRRIVIGGIGRMFYQDGFPISIAAAEFKKNGYEISYLHIADELLKNGWSKIRVVNTLRATFEEDVDKDVQDMNLADIDRFCSIPYENQREMIFTYLFKNDTELAKKWFNENYNERNS